MRNLNRKGIKMLVLCDRKWCRYIKYNVIYGYHCGYGNCISLISGKCKNYFKIDANEMKKRREDAPFKNMY